MVVLPNDVPHAFVEEGSEDQVRITQPASFSKKLKDFLMSKKFLTGLGIFVLVVLIGAILSLNNEKPLTKYYKGVLNQSIPICQDFYQFACGKQVQKYKTRGYARYDTISSMQDRTLAQLDQLLSEVANANDSPILANFKTFYRACIDEATTQNISVITDWIYKMGGWPMLGLGNYSHSAETWEDIVISVNKAGVSVLFPFQLFIYPHPNNESRNSMLLMPYLYQVKELYPNQNRTFEYWKNIMVSLGTVSENLIRSITFCLKFEYELNKRSKFSELDYKHHTLAELIEMFPQIRWAEFLESALTSEEQLDEDEVLWFGYPEYTSKVLKFLDETPAEIVRDYLVWKMLQQAMIVMPSGFRQAQVSFRQQLRGRSRNLECVEFLKTKATVAMSELCIQRHFDHTLKTKAEEVYANVQKEAREYLRKLDWIGNSTQAAVLKNLASLEATVAYHDAKPDLESLFQAWSFQRNATAFSNYVDFLTFDRRFTYLKLKMPVDVANRLIPLRHAFKAYPVFSLSTNITYFPVAMLQPPYLRKDQPASLTYGTLGFAMAQEIFTGLDIDSACISPRCPSYRQFLDVKDCVRSLYDGYTIGQIGEKVNGRRTVSRNIIDIMGLKVAYNAYKAWYQNHTETESRIEGFNYTDDQWFWIGATTSICSYYDDDYLKLLLNGPRSSAEATINKGLFNMQDFLSDFNCTISTNTITPKKCKLD